MQNKTKVLLIGAPRSGTTLLAGLISSGNEASPMVPECTYITQIIQHYYNFLHYSDPQRFAAYAINEENLLGIYRGMVDSMLASVQSHFIKMDYKYLVLKDPELTLLIDLIPTFFGETSKVVCIVRDPRAVIASMFEVERKKKKQLWSMLIKTPSWEVFGSYVTQLLREKKLISDFYIYYWRIHESELYKRGDLHIVNFEKVINHDEDEYKRLESYLGFPIGRDGFAKVYFDFDRSDPTYSTGYGQKIQTKSSDFTKKLSFSRVRKIKAMFAGMNKIYGWWL